MAKQRTGPADEHEQADLENEEKKLQEEDPQIDEPRDYIEAESERQSSAEFNAKVLGDNGEDPKQDDENPEDITVRRRTIQNLCQGFVRGTEDIQVAILEMAKELRSLNERMGRGNVSTQEVIQKDPDSLAIGTPGNGGVIKVYGDFRYPTPFIKRVDNAIGVIDHVKMRTGR